MVFVTLERFPLKSGFCEKQLRISLSSGLQTLSAQDFPQKWFRTVGPKKWRYASVAKKKWRYASVVFLFSVTPLFEKHVLKKTEQIIR